MDAYYVAASKLKAPSPLLSFNFDDFRLKEMNVTKAIFGNHAAVRVRKAERDRIWSFYLDVLGCTLMRSFDHKDDIRLGDDFYIAFLYAVGDGRGADRGANYAAEDVLGDEDFLRAVFLDLKTDNVEEMKAKILAFGVKTLDVPDPQLNFQAPGGQAFRLVGIDEDLSVYERSSS